jgi:response regulator RpfG family c-di-GMP phosphodiesterase
MRQLALHLGSNAVKFTPPGGSVTFVLTGDGRDVGLEVDDTGIGIPRDALERIFERFYQVDSSLVRRYGGTGLGLAICKSIAEWHGGQVHADSTPGEGSRFYVSLPRRSRPRVIVQPGPAPEAAAEDILRLAIEMVADVMGARAVSLLCPEPDGRLMIRAAMGLDEDVVRHERIEPGGGVAGWVAKHRRPICVSGADASAEVTGSGRDRYRSHTFMSVPIELNGELLGVLNATDPISPKGYSAEDCHLFLQLAHRIAAAWHQTLDAQEHQAGVADTAHTLRELLRHLERGRRIAPDRVRLARALARQMGLSESDVAAISYAASVHDVGMRTLGEQIVDSPGALTDEERRQVEGHPEAGAALLAPLESAGGVRDLVLSHHEWWDGNGYPRGLKGDEIPMGSRVLALVDAFESMTVGRPHRPPMSRDEVLKELAQLAGQQFDPRVVEVLPHALTYLDSPPASESADTTQPTPADPGR